jgi:hypothetical protein
MRGRVYPRPKLSVKTEDSLVQASFDQRQDIGATEAGDRPEHDALDQNQSNPEPVEANNIKDLPKELGVMLITAGVVGLIPPGPGMPAIVAGGLVLWPNAFGKLETWLEQAHPKVHRKGMQQINRFLSDLEKRYP